MASTSYMRHSRQAHELPTRAYRAAVFVDYQNLYSVISDRLDQRGYPDEYIAEMLDELRQYLQDEERAGTSVAVAFADFSALSGNGFFIQRSLYLQGVEPRFIPSSMEPTAVELQFCTDVSEVLHRRSDIDLFVLLTGNRCYVPLVQQIKRYGRLPIVATLDSVPTTESIQYAEVDFHLDAHHLLGEASRRELLSGAPAGSRQGSLTGADSPPREPIEFTEVTDPIQLQTLDIIETYFGQYEEVYLTPLLRKLSELLDDREHDPKTIISTLEEHGAIRLEKRRGFPYDYTVLIVESEHPDVQRVQEQVLERDGAEDDASDEFSDDYYDKYEEEDYSEEDYSEEDFEDDGDLPDEPTVSEENLGGEPR